MTVRFIIRRIVQDGRNRWSLRDGRCRNSETHDFENIYWSDDCDGWCDTLGSFKSAIATVSEIK